MEVCINNLYLTLIVQYVDCVLLYQWYIINQVRPQNVVLTKILRSLGFSLRKARCTSSISVTTGFETVTPAADRG